MAMALLIALIYACWTMWLHSRILTAEQITPARSSSFSHHCASPKGEDQHFKLLFLFIVSKPCCREDFSLQIEEDRRQTRNHSILVLGNQVKQSSGWCHLSQNTIRTIQPDQEGNTFSFLKRTFVIAERCFLPGPGGIYTLAPVTQSKIEGTKLLMQRVSCRYCNSVYSQSWAKDASSSTLTSRNKGILHLQKQMGRKYLCKQGASILRYGCLDCEMICLPLSSASKLGSRFVPLRISICRRQFTINP